MNNCFHEPVIAAQAGGRHGGGAALTPFGKRLIDQYRAIEAACKAPPEPTPATKPRAAPRRRTIAR